ncbi:MAG: Lrp/AsnC family transcriptional regulator, partial [Candidatus Methanomethylophilaceae archaeon]|nr:Lrp/AsnC family transcriptional regulator [Candidatus Methanomethylophilaceae archaeon]
MGLEGYDELDKRIIELLSTSSQGSYRQIAKTLDVHPSTLIQRVKNLESRGVIRGYRANIDYMKLGFEFMGVVNVNASDVIAVQDKIS